MSEHAVVTALNTTSGKLAVQRSDGSFVLAELLDAHNLRTGQTLEGSMQEFGPETWVDVGTQQSYEVFVQAWDLSQSAVDMEFANDY